MNIIFLEVGIFNVVLLFIIYLQLIDDKKNNRDCRLFSNLVLSCITIVIIDTIGWLIDGVLSKDLNWVVDLVDGLDLMFTTTVCYFWVKYVLYIADDKKTIKHNLILPRILLVIQFSLLLFNISGRFYYYIDMNGVYQRGSLYFIHSLISMILLSFSSFYSIHVYLNTKDVKLKKELLFVAFIILLPVLGNLFQYYVYGYPTVWLCMVIMIMCVFIQIQNKRTANEKTEQNLKLKETIKKMEIASKAKTDFMNHMSHDLRTPLNGIIGLSYIMEKEDDVEDVRKQIKELRETANYLLQLINDILDINKIESGVLELHPKVVDEKVLFDSIINIIEPEIEQKNLDFHFDKINIDWTYMLLDDQRVKQIFVNLLNNAIKFTPKNGRIDFIMELVSINDEEIVDKFIIRDSGIGMSKEFIEKIYEPFEQENRIFVDSTGGTGLGLPIVKELVELMKGSIDIKSEENVGTEVTLYLTFPLAQQPNIKEEKNVEYKSLKNKRVLLCEDQKLNAKIAIKLLEREGMIVTWADDGLEGLNIFEASKINHFDVILMDIRMPNLDGLAATKKIRALKRDDATRIPIIAMSANAFEEDIQKSLDAGMNEHLSKPIVPELLFTTISKYIK